MAQETRSKKAGAVKVTFPLAPSLRKKLNALAKKKNTSVAQLMRDAVQRIVK